MSTTTGTVSPVELHYKWTINNFSSERGKKHIQSARFSINCFHPKYTWVLYLYPNGKRDEDNGYLSVFLYNCKNTLFTASVSFGILNNKDEVVKMSVSEEIPQNKGWGLHQFVETSTIMDIVLENEDTLAIIFDIKFNDGNNREEHVM